MEPGTVNFLHYQSHKSEHMWLASDLIILAVLYKAD